MPFFGYLLVWEFKRGFCPHFHRLIYCVIVVFYALSLFYLFYFILFLLLYCYVDIESCKHRCHWDTFLWCTMISKSTVVLFCIELSFENYWWLVKHRVLCCYFVTNCFWSSKPVFSQTLLFLLFLLSLFFVQSHSGGSFVCRGRLFSKPWSRCTILTLFN